MNDLVSTAIEKVKNPSNIVAIAISSIISTIYITYFPLILFFIYMGHNRFFSYDFYIDGVFAINSFILLSAIFLVLLSFMVFGSIFTMFCQHSENKKVLTKTNIALIAFNIFMIILLISVSYGKQTLDFYIFYFALSFFIQIHLSVSFYGKPEKKIGSLLFFIFATLYMVTHMTEQVSGLVSYSLRHFGIGGGINVVLQERSPEKTKVEGKLLLRSPSHLYLKIKDTNEIATLKQRELQSQL